MDISYGLTIYRFGLNPKSITIAECKYCCNYSDYFQNKKKQTNNEMK